jgi:hypothetical protein
MQFKIVFLITSDHAVGQRNKMRLITGYSKEEIEFI